MPRQFNTEDLRKALDVFNEYEQDNAFDYDEAREALINRAVRNNLLDDFIEEQIRYERENDPDYYDDPGYDPDDPISQSDIDAYGRNLDSAELPDDIPYHHNVSVDPDYEDLNVYNLVNENPKAREFFTQRSVQFNPSERGEAGDRFLRALRAGVFTPSQLNTLRNIRNVGTSRTLESELTDSTAYEIANFINRAATGRDVAPLEPVYENVADTINTVGDLASIDSALRAYTDQLEEAQSRLNRYQREASTPSASPETSTRRGAPVQLSLPLQVDPNEGRLSSVSADISSLPTSFNTLSELTDARNRLHNIQRSLGDYVSIRRDPDARATEFIRSSVLPSVRDALGDVDADRAARNEYRNIVQGRRFAADAERLSRSPAPPSSFDYSGVAMPALERSPEGTEPIPGLNEILQRDRFDRVRAVISQFPEVERLLSSKLTTNERRPVRGAAAKPYLSYADTDQVISLPEDRKAVYETMLKNVPEFVADPAEGLKIIDDLETLYSSGDPGLQRQAINNITMYGYGDEIRSISSPATYSTRPIVGGGGYVGGVRDTNESKALKQKISNRATTIQDIVRNNKDVLRSLYPDYFDRPDIPRKLEVVYDPDTDTVRPAGPRDTNVYGIEVSTSNPGLDLTGSLSPLKSGTLSSNALKFFADNPILGTSSVSFTTRTPSTGYSYEHKDLPSAVSDEFGRFTQRTALQGLPPGTLVTNSPLDSRDLLETKLREGKTADTSSTVRKLEAFENEGYRLPNLRAAAYTTAGFGPLSGGMQYAYIDANGNVVPVQPSRPSPGFGDAISVNPNAGALKVFQGRLPLTTKAYYSFDPVSAAAKGLQELGQGIKRTPSALLPGAADLIPSPEAIRTGYQKGPVEMGKQMGTEFVQSLPASAAAAAVLATPAAAPFAPGIGAGMVGVAGTKALNEVVRQQTGEGIVPKLRQTIGTAPRTGVASPQRQGPAMTPQIRPLNQAQRTEMQRRQNRNELQKRIDLVRERFNPAKGEFGLSEMLFGR